jgi:hypothetical protein
VRQCGSRSLAKAAATSLRPIAWKVERQSYRRTWRVWLGVIVEMDGLDTQFACSIRSLRNTRQRIAAMSANNG